MLLMFALVLEACSTLRLPVERPFWAGYMKEIGGKLGPPLKIIYILAYLGKQCITLQLKAAPLIN